MKLQAVTFKQLITTIFSQFDTNQVAYCVDGDFGGQTNKNAREFFTVVVHEADLPRNLAAVGILSDDSVYTPGRQGCTFIIYIDSSRKYTNMTQDLRNIFIKAFLAHEVCHFAFYYELFLVLGGEISTKTVDMFQNKVSHKLPNAISIEQNNTYETVVEEHQYSEFINNFDKYPAKHFTKNNPSDLDYKELFNMFFYYLTLKVN
ncbi:MAG: hypothetical protein LBM77_03640 [Spirochaetaceae bacterium]|jgi:hypothetical protein|nr:hypothetical protein [Spirochaetaceae bacterium]